MNPCSDGWLNPTCALPGWGAAVIGGLAGLLAALVALYGTRKMDRRAQRRSATRAALIPLLRILDAVNHEQPQDYWPGVPQVSDERTETYVTTLAQVDVDLRDKQARKLAWGVRAVMWHDRATSAMSVEAPEQVPEDEYDKQAGETRRFLREARDGMLEWLREERTSALKVALPPGVTVGARPTESPPPT